MTELVTVTEAMRVGSMVDAIMTEPSTVDMESELYDYCKLIAYNIKKQLPLNAIKMLQKQISYTAEFHYGGFVLPVKGRLDFEIQNVLTIDLKVSGVKSLDAIINYMGYENQVIGYSLMADNPNAMIIGYLKPLKVVQLRSVEVSNINEFWKDKIMKFGTVND